MSDRPIQVGDLVQIIRARGCCPDHTSWGYTFVVSKIMDSNWVCLYCGKEHERLLCAFEKDTCIAETRRLKRIPPLEELEGQRTEEKLKEPA